MELRAGDLRCRIAVYGGRNQRMKNGETNTVYDTPPRYVWAKIVPVSGRLEELDGGAEIMAVTHKCYVRAKSLPDIRPDMFFMYREQRYEILHYMPVYACPGWLELDCVMTIEHGAVYGNW